MVEQLGALTALAERPQVQFSIPTWRLTTANNSSSRGFDTSSSVCRLMHMYGVYTNSQSLTHVHIKQLKIFQYMFIKPQLCSIKKNKIKVGRS